MRRRKFKNPFKRLLCQELLDFQEIRFRGRGNGETRKATTSLSTADETIYICDRR